MSRKFKSFDGNSNIIDNPLLHIAQSISESRDEQVFEENPVDIVEFVESKNFLNQKWNGKRGCRPKILEVLQNIVKPNIRECMVMLGKGCLAGDTQISTCEGIFEIKDLVGKEIDVDCINDKTILNGITKARGVYSGEKKVYKIYLRNGRKLKLTENHKLFSVDGWKELKNLNINDHIALPREIINIKSDKHSEDFYKMIGLLLGDGCINSKRIILTCSNIDIHNEFVRCIESCYPEAKWHRGEKFCNDTYIAYRDKNNNICKIYEDFKELGLIGCRAANKKVPLSLLKSSKKQTIALLSGLVSTDGWLECRGTGGGIYFCSNSEQLIQDFKTLCLHIGIPTSYRDRSLTGIGGKSIGITARDDIIKFLDLVPLHNENRDIVYEFVKNSGVKENRNYDIIPWQLIAPLFGYTKHDLPKKWRYGKNKRILQKISKKKNNFEYMKYSNLEWSQIIKIEELGVEKVYDLICECENTHNFIANGIWVHNSGKDYLSSIVHLYGIYRSLCMVNPQSFYGLSPTPIYFINTARNEKQSKRVFFAQFTSLLKECPWFEGKYREPGAETVIFDKNISALSVNSQAFGWLGFNTIQWVGDELAFFLENDKEETSASRAEECWQAAFGSCKTRFPKHYKMIGITTPRYDDDFVMKKFWELNTREDGYSVKAPTWEVNPNLTKEDFKNELMRDYRRTMRDFGAEPVGLIESFWPEQTTLEDMVCEKCRQCPVYQNRKSNREDNWRCYDFENCEANPYKGNGEWRDWFVPIIDQNEYWIHFDLAKSKDKIGFTLAHIRGEVRLELDAFKLKEKEQKGEDITSEDERFEEKPLIFVAAIGFISAGKHSRDTKMLKNNEFYYQALLDNVVYRLSKKGFNIIGVSFDQYNSHFIKQVLEDRGYQTELLSCDRTDEIPSRAKYAVLEQRVEYPFCDLLCEEAKYLKYIAGKKVDHASGRSKDIWDSFASAIYGCEMFLVNKGAFEFAGDDDE